MKLLLPSLFSLVFVMMQLQLFSQIRDCGMEQHMEQLLQNPKYLEKHLDKLARVEAMSNTKMNCSSPIIIPVAIHFQNISNPDISCLQALAQNQIDIVNQDFQGINSDISIWNDDASSFFPGINNGESCVEFCIATQEHPNGFGLQDGDLAVTINQTSGDFISQWPNYVNIIVRNISALGYSPLGGDGDGDGVVIDIAAFGSSSGCGQVNPNPPYDLGRTLTHELGHYFLLNHIWRNNGCGLDDLVDDTPLQDDEYFGCPALGVASCGSNDMHMNYMDYVNDACMYMFSAGQVIRMENYINSSLTNVINNGNVVCSGSTSTCDDGIQNGNETGIDCGGPECPDCPVEPTCDDGIQNGSETGIDCGGPNCPECPIDPTCDDGIQNGNETGIDCGGPDCPACPTCNDGIQNGDETDIDCGGADCPACPTCNDGVQNGDETEVDCGGPDCPDCPTCDDGIQNGDETDVDCGGADCLACPTCNDGVQNGDETGVDCGGSDCSACPTCDDGILNGEETDVDCGGPDCPACSSCDDGMQNGNETGIDCGGPDCPDCLSCTENFLSLVIVLDVYGNQTTWELTDENDNLVVFGGPYSNNSLGLIIVENFCLDNACYTFTIYDQVGNGICCVRGEGSYSLVNNTDGTVLANGGEFGSSESTDFCLNNIPGTPTCNDGVQNGDETGVDCGGSTCPTCPPDPSCDDGLQNGEETGVDCGGLDCPACPTCDDGIQNGDETGVDCGGSACPACPPNPTCTDGVQNGNETGIDCGGPDCPVCPVDPTCTDGVQNGNETGIDCGGPECDPCVDNCLPPDNSYVEYLGNPNYHFYPLE